MKTTKYGRLRTIIASIFWFELRIEIGKPICSIRKVFVEIQFENKNRQIERHGIWQKAKGVLEKVRWDGSSKWETREKTSFLFCKSMNHIFWFGKTVKIFSMRRNPVTEMSGSIELFSEPQMRLITPIYSIFEY